MIQEIKYNGYSASPSDYQSPDGDMASMLNCIPHRGALRPILPPETVKHFDEDTTVLAIHRVADREHYILYAGTDLYWEERDSPNKGILYDFREDGGVASVTPIGNTLAVLDAGGTIHYFLWKTDAYTNLGTQLPELNVSPYLASRIYDIQAVRETFGEDYESDKFSLEDYCISGNGMLDAADLDQMYTNIEFELKGDKQQKIYEKVFARLNHINRLLQSNGALTSPFYVRFAYRLYDGRHVKHTAPILLTPTSLGAPLLKAYYTLQNGAINNMYFFPLYTASFLTAAFRLPHGFDVWSDIISHIDVFITPQIINYSDDSKSLRAIVRRPCDPLLIDNNTKWNTVNQKYSDEIPVSEFAHYSLYFKTSLSNGVKIACKRGKEAAILCVPNFDAETHIIDSKGQRYNFHYISQANLSGVPQSDGGFALLLSDEEYTYYGPSQAADVYIDVHRTSNMWAPTPDMFIDLRRTDGKTFEEALTDYDNFYKVHEFSTQEYKDGFSGTIPLKANTLTNIVTLPTLPDTGQHNSQFAALSLFSYNNRLNAVVGAEHLPPCSALTEQNPARGDMSNYTIDSAYIKVVENSQTSYIRVKDEMSQVGDLKLVYFSYPRATATELQVYYSDSAGQVYVQTIPLTRHPFLNLTYAFNMFEAIEGNFTECSAIPNYPQTPILYGNKIKTSDVNNPFIFSEENTSQLPVGKIYALSTAAKALSQGQFGQFPLYAFTDKGVWALEVTGTGTYSARQPITRDVVLSPQSVTQIDDAVLFATQRGIMLLSGSQVQCISEVLDGKAFDWEQYGFAYKKTGELGLPTFVIPWEQYKANIQMLYDYTGQRIIVFNPRYVHAYVFSLDSKQWGIMESYIKSTVDYYPQAYAMTKDGTLVDYSIAHDDVATGYYITRPLKLGAPDIHKTVTSIIQRGQFKRGHVNTMLYGSRDLEKWYPVYGSTDHILRGMRGTPYKYFRLASTFTLTKDESITGFSIDFEPRLNNKLR